MKPGKPEKKVAEEGSPENDDGGKTELIPPDSYQALGAKIYEALTSLPLKKRILLARATTEERRGDEMRSDPELAEVLRILRYPERPAQTKSSKIKSTTEN